MKTLQIIGWIWFALFIIWTVIEFTSSVGDTNVPRAMWWLQFSSLGLIVALLSTIARRLKPKPEKSSSN
jgi:hypothetical protein